MDTGGLMWGATAIKAEPGWKLSRAEGQHSQVPGPLSRPLSRPPAA